MRSARLWPLLALTPLLAGCPPAILSQQPFGDEIAVLKPKYVDGLWLMQDKLIGIRVVDAKQGRFKFWVARDYAQDGPLHCQPPPELPDTCLSRKPGGGGFEGTCRLRRLKLENTDSNDYTYLFIDVRLRDHVYATTGVANLEGHSAAVVYPVWEASLGPYMAKKKLRERLRQLIAEHKLPGRVDAKGEVILGPLSLKNYRFILSQKSGLIDWRAGVPIIKLPDEYDPCKKQQELKPDTATKPNGKTDTSRQLER